MYITASEIYAATKLTTDVVPEASVQSFILAAEKYIDRYTLTTYWSTQFDAQQVASSTSEIITIGSATYTNDELIGMYVWIYSGDGSDQIVKIIDNTTTTITLESELSTVPVNGDKFRIIYTASTPFISEAEDGNDERFYFLPEYPIRKIESLSIDNTSISLSSLFRYDKIGKIQLSDSSEVFKFTEWKPQTISYSYWYGVYPMPQEVKRAVIVLASMYTLAAQTGGTFDVPSTYSLPEGSVTIGQAYVNIRETYNMLAKEWQALERILIKYPKVV